MTYTINGKEGKEFDINKRCADLMGIEYNTSDQYVMVLDNAASIESGYDEEMEYNPCQNPSDTDAIIDKCWDELMSVKFEYYALTRWQYLRHEHNCTKLVAACICYIEMQEGT
jgi:hypothetical protein